MKKNEMEDIVRLTSKTEATTVDKELALHYVRLYVNPGFTVCKSCPSSVRKMFNILKDWWNKQNKSAYSFIKTKE